MINQKNDDLSLNLCAQNALLNKIKNYAEIIGSDFYGLNCSKKPNIDITLIKLNDFGIYLVVACFYVFNYKKLYS